MGGQGRYKHSMEDKSRTVHDNIKRGVQGHMEAGLLVWLILLQNNRGGSLLRFIVVVLISVTPMTTPWQALCSC
jgi:hypothetical protein